MSSSYAVQVENLAKCYRLFERPMHRVLQMLRPGKSHLGREFWALRDVSFAVQPGEAFGIVGRNGAAKAHSCRFWLELCHKPTEPRMSMGGLQRCWNLAVALTPPSPEGKTSFSMGGSWG